MNDPVRQRRSLQILAVVCLLPLPFVIGAFLVNIEIGLRVFWPGSHVFDHVLPQGLYSLYALLSADLSTVSTLIPVLMLLYPLVQAIRILRRQETDPGFVQQLEATPYPPHFGFFMIMLGLTGTLYGMFIGLNVSGVAELAGQAPTPEAIRRSLDRLLGGTATALLSSLVGLIGAFFASRSIIPAIFRRVAGITSDDSPITLSETIDQLTCDLRGLSQASRIFAARLKPELADDLFERMGRQEAATHAVARQLEQVNISLLANSKTQQETNQKLQSLELLAATVNAVSDKIGQTNTKLDAIERAQSIAADRLRPLESAEQAVRALLSALETTNQHLTKLNQMQQNSNVLLGQCVAAGTTQNQEILQRLSAMILAAQSYTDHLQRDQHALRLALSAYLQPNEASQHPAH